MRVYHRGNFERKHRQIVVMLFAGRASDDEQVVLRRVPKLNGSALVAKERERKIEREMKSFSRQEMLLYSCAVVMML